MRRSQVPERSPRVQQDTHRSNKAWSTSWPAPSPLPVLPWPWVPRLSSRRAWLPPLPPSWPALPWRRLCRRLRGRCLLGRGLRRCLGRRLLGRCCLGRRLRRCLRGCRLLHRRFCRGLGCRLLSRCGLRRRLRRSLRRRCFFHCYGDLRRRCFHGCFLCRCLGCRRLRRLLRHIMPLALRDGRECTSAGNAYLTRGSLASEAIH